VASHELKGILLLEYSLALRNCNTKICRTPMAVFGKKTLRVSSGNLAFKYLFLELSTYFFVCRIYQINIQYVVH
jgi:hypothetical protein